MMKLIDCYIENFGGLKDFSYSFSEGLNILKEDNGFGKTTLSVFIKAMLFGLDDTKKTKIEENDRKHYMPWQGGRCGGSLTFRTGRKTYRIERTFATKASDDSFALFDCDTGKPSSDYSEKLGEELFRIDADGFERTVFLSERKLSVKNDNKSISAKLSDLVGSDGDVGELDKAIASLEERRKYYQKKGGAGKITDIKKQLTALDIEINQKERLKDGYAEKEAGLHKLSGELAELEAKKRDSEKKKHALGYEKQYLAMKKRKEENERRFAELSKFFNGSPVSVEQIRAAERDYDEYRRLRQDINSENSSDTGTAFSMEELNGYIKAAETNSVTENVKKRFHMWGVLSLVSLLLGALLGYFISQILYTVCLFCLVFGVLTVVNLLRCVDNAKSANALTPAIVFAEEVLGRRVTSDTLCDALSEIRAKEAARRELIALRSEEKKSNLERADRLEAAHRAFLARFRISEPDPFTEIRNKLSEYEYLKRELREADGDLINYVREYGIKADRISIDHSESEEKLANVDELEAEIRRLRSDAIMLERDCRADLEEIAKIDELNERRLELTDAYNDAVHRHETILLTKEHLMRAKDSLTSKYLGKTKAAFASYLELVSGENPELFTMDTTFALLRSEGGKSIPGDAYSLGTRELYSLITRFALADSLYEEEKPFILLDDPFAHFDDKKTAAAMKLLKRLAQSNQIIYFTCSKSRSL